MTCGILLLDKPQGLSSSTAVQRVRRAFGRVKGGHTGSLDPLATGMLPICLGEATKVAGYLLDGDKRYAFTARFGARTTTGDLEGEVAATAPVPADLRAALEAVLPRFRGALSQIPPMYSAIKQAGQPLYRLARQGIEVERAARQVVIHSLTLEAVREAEADFTVSCSKGTYVRTLAEDLAMAAGSLAHLGFLRRLSVEPFAEEAMVTLAAVEADPGCARLLPPDAALTHLAAVRLEAQAARRLCQGQAVRTPEPLPAAGMRLRIYDPQDFLGIGEALPDGLLRPVRLFNHLDAQ
ncbi:MAG: tRNA pseudouridine(55) synthase TruB [Steroidobacteraceae bacterium]